MGANLHAVDMPAQIHFHGVAALAWIGFGSDPPPWIDNIILCLLYKVKRNADFTIALHGG